MATIEEIPLSSAIAAEELRDALDNEQGLQRDSHVGENDGEPGPIHIPTYASVESPWKARIVEAATIPLHTGKIVVYTIQTIADDSVTCTVSRRYSRSVHTCSRACLLSINFSCQLWTVLPAFIL
jgi:hypothetical protein